MSPIAHPAASAVRDRHPRYRVSRKQLIEKAKARMAMPRVQMTVLLALTGGAGFLASYLLLQVGLGNMALRYPLAVGAAYLVFFVLLRLWLAFQRDPFEIVGDALDLAGDVGDLCIDAIAVPRSPSLSKGASSFDFDFSGLDSPAALLFLAIAAGVAAVVLGAVIYVLYLAPVLLAEVLVDGVLLVGLYRRLKGTEPEQWVFGAIRRTWIPATVVAMTFFLAGTIFQRLAPEARSIGGVWEAVRTEESSAD